MVEPGGLVVGMTSVGSGSLMIVLLLLLYPTMTSSRLVGSDLVQAIPLVGSAALGHVLFGDFHLDVAASLLIGALPGVYVGARWSASAPDHVIRPALVIVLAASGLKLVGVHDTRCVVMVKRPRPHRRRLLGLCWTVFASLFQTRRSRSERKGQERSGTPTGITSRRPGSHPFEVWALTALQ